MHIAVTHESNRSSAAAREEDDVEVAPRDDGDDDGDDDDRDLLVLSFGISPAHFLSILYLQSLPSLLYRSPANTAYQRLTKDTDADIGDDSRPKETGEIELSAKS